MSLVEDFGARLHRGDLALSQGRNPEAETELRAALELQPRSVKANFKLGIALERQRKWAPAEMAFREAIRWKRDHALAWLRLAASCRRQGKSVEEEEAIREAARLAPTNAEACHNLAVTLARLGRLGEAVTAYLQAIAVAPGNPVIHDGLGMVYMAQRRHEDAASAFREERCDEIEIGERCVERRNERRFDPLVLDDLLRDNRGPLGPVEEDMRDAKL